MHDNGQIYPIIANEGAPCLIAHAHTTATTLRERGHKLHFFCPFWSSRDITEELASEVVALHFGAISARSHPVLMLAGGSRKSQQLRSRRGTPIIMRRESGFALSRAAGSASLQRCMNVAIDDLRWIGLKGCAAEWLILFQRV